MNLDHILTYLENNKDQYINELVDFLKLPSISADSKYKDDMLRTANFIKDKLISIGLDNVEVCPTKGHPVVYAEKIIDANYPTVLVYGHYDVQPVDPINLWDSGPFEPVIKKTEIHPEGAIFARGACDDKGQAYMHIIAIEALLKHNALMCNVKFMIEGEEEIGSVNLGEFCRNNKEKLKSDVVLVSDTSIIDNQTPSITVGLRGLSYLEVEVLAANRDLHSGVYGGAVANPINVLAKMIASLHDENNRITVKGLYDDVLTVSDEERALMNKAPFDIKQYESELGIADVYGEKGYTTIERTSIRPSLDCNGIWGGYIGEGAKTVLPSKAFAKISIRLVPNQSSHKITELFRDHFMAIAPKGVEVKVTPHHGGEPVLTPTDSIEYKAAAMAMEKSFSKIPLPQRSGGSIPIIAMFDEVLNVKSVLMGFGLDSDNIHSPNEHFGIFNYMKGITTIPYFYHYYSQLKKSSN
ncbi:MAG: dipeptidase [Saprospiraceae bacterium]|nr:dipeptidase [Saprospiraceae bacterium]